MEFGDGDDGVEVEVCAAQTSVEDDKEAMFAGVESQPVDVLQTETTTVGWLEQRVERIRCKCPRCIYARPRDRELPRAFECQVMLDVHETLYPICPKQRLTMQNHVEYSKPRPPPTVYMFLQRDNPLLRPDEDLDVSAEIDRARIAWDVHVAAVKKQRVMKRRVDGFVRMSYAHEEPETAMFDVFMEAAERWKSGDKYERLAQFQEAMTYYKTTKELPARTTPSQYPLVGYGRNWFKQ